MRKIRSYTIKRPICRQDRVYAAILPVDLTHERRSCTVRELGFAFERALVLQAWHAAGGTPRDVVIGVARSEPNFRAHAWLDGDPSVRESEFEVLRRQPPVHADAEGSSLT